MAEKRMFTKKITQGDDFIAMPHSSQNLYWHLNMEADDEGFVNSPKRVIRMINASEDDIKLLLAKRFLIGFESGVIVIKHWKMHNVIRNERLKSTSHVDERNRLSVKENGSYTESKLLCQTNDGQVADNCQTNVRIDKIRLEENRLDEISLEEDILCASSKDYASVINYLNEKTGKNFRIVDSTKRLIDIRLKEGFLIDDFYRVIDNQCDKWLKDAKMIDYLRPQTLFGTKFESYLNTIKKKKFNIMDL